MPNNAALSHFVNEQGHLTDEAKLFLKEPLGKNVADILSIGKTTNEVRLISSALLAYISKMTTDRITLLSKETQ